MASPSGLMWVRTTRVAYFDASDTGFGGYVVELEREVVQGWWSADEAKLSSTWRELQNLLVSFAPKLQGYRLKWFTDNHSEKYIFANGSKWAHLQDGALCTLLGVHPAIRG